MQQVEELEQDNRRTAVPRFVRRLFVPNYVNLLVASIVVATSLAVAGWLVQSRGTFGPTVELGKWLMTSATASLAAGFFGVLLRFVEERRNRRAAWENQLCSLIEANQRVRRCARILRARQDNETLHAQMEELLRVRGHLRAIAAHGGTARDWNLTRALKEMLRVVSAVTLDYERYCSDARSQRKEVAAIEEWRRESATRQLLERGRLDIEYRHSYRVAKQWMRFRADITTKRPNPWTGLTEHDYLNGRMVTLERDIEDEDEDLPPSTSEKTSDASAAASCHMVRGFQ